MDVQRVDPRKLDDATSERLAEMMNASMHATGQNRVPMTAAAVRAQATYTHDDRPFDAMWLAHDDGQVVGTGSLELELWDNDHMGMVFCTVDPAYWRRGIGTALLEAAADWARDSGVKKLELHVFPYNTGAIKLYERFGFTKEGYRHAHYKRGDEYVDAILMAYDV